MKWLKYKLHLKTSAIILVIYLIVNAIVIVPSLLDDITPVDEHLFHLTYVADDLYNGLKILSWMTPQNGLVLASPFTSTDIMIPGLTGKRTYSGHLLMTYNVTEKDKLANSFFYKWTDQNKALDFIRKEKIDFVVWTKYSGDVNQIKQRYKFLQPVYENNAISIFTIKNS